MDAHEALRKTRLFQNLSPQYLDRLSSVARERSYKAGETIVREGDQGIAFFVIVSGNVEVLRGSGGDQTVINRIGPGGTFGEIALLTEFPRLASVRAENDVTCVALARLDFLDALRDQPEIAVQLLATVAEMLRMAEQRASSAARS